MKPVMLRSALLLAGIVCLAVVVLGTTWTLTRPGIEAAGQDLLRESLQQVLGASGHDNALAADRIQVRAAALGSRRVQSVYRARRGGTPVALVITSSAPDGYTGAIDLLVACDTDGRTLGVRVLAHRETPGLGDVIEGRRSDWIRQFDNLPLVALSSVPVSPARESGVDLMTGATITTQAVTDAVQRTVVWALSRKTVLFNTPRGRTLAFPRAASGA